MNMKEKKMKYIKDEAYCESCGDWFRTKITHEIFYIDVGDYCPACIKEYRKAKRSYIRTGINDLYIPF